MKRLVSECAEKVYAGGWDLYLIAAVILAFSIFLITSCGGPLEQPKAEVTACSCDADKELTDYWYRKYIDYPCGDTSDE